MQFALGTQQRPFKGLKFEAQWSWKSLAYWSHCFQLLMQNSKRRRTDSTYVSEVNKMER